MTRARASVALAASLLACATGPAAAELTVSAQARTAGAEWMTGLPTPPAVTPICVVDAGADRTPDAAPVLLARHSVVGDEVGDQNGPEGHGTTIVQLIGARQDGWGAVGLWPRALAASIRASQPVSVGRSVFEWSDFSRALFECRANHPAAKVISLSLGGPPNQSADYAEFANYVAKLGAVDGISVVASAGNGASTEPHFPSDTPGVIAVAAVAGDGSRCAFSNHRPGMLAAQGCGVEVAGASGAIRTVAGTSYAVPQVAALLAAIRSYAPGLSREQAEAAVLDSARPGPDGLRTIDARGAFERAGLGALVPPPEPPSSPPAPAAPLAPPPPAAPASVPVARVPSAATTTARRPPRPRRRSTRRVRTGLVVTWRVPARGRLLVTPSRAARRIRRDRILIRATGRARVVGVRVRLDGRRSAPVRVRVPSRRALARALAARRSAARTTAAPPRPDQLRRGGDVAPSEVQPPPPTNDAGGFPRSR